MDIQIKHTEQSADEEDITFEALLGEGKFQVYSVYSHKENTRYALKVFPKDSIGDFYYKKEQILTRLHHPNIIKNYSVTGHNGEFNCMLIEFAPFGDFLQLTMRNAFQSEAIIRTYFHQLIEGIEYLHSQGIAHLDLKLDNLVLGSDFKLKIIDFEQAQSIKDTKMNSFGTPHYRAPEVINKNSKNMSAVDVYSAGIILYILIGKEFPFYETTDEKGVCVQHYSIFVEDKPKFWAMKSSCQDENVFTSDLIELLNKMLESDPKKRIKLQEIKDSKWYQGPVVSQERLNVQMKTIVDSFSKKTVEI